MKKIILALLLIVSIFIIFLIVTMSMYIHSFEPWYSFMTLEKAVITLVLLCILLLVILLAIVLMILKIKNNKRSNS